MKRYSYLLLLICLTFLLPASANTEPDIDELIARSKITTFKSIHEVFTPQELDMLYQHYHGEDWDQSNSVNGPNTLVYGTEDQTKGFGTFDINDPAVFNMIMTSPAPAFEGGGAISDDGSLAYSIDSDNNLFEIDILTGNYVMLGKVVPPNGETITGLEMDPTDNNKLYAMSSDGSQSSLSYIDTLTLVVTLVAVTTLVVAISLAITASGDLYTMDIDDDKLYWVNKLTAAVILIGAIGFDANFGQGMARAALTGLIFMAAFNNTVFDSELRSVNLVTGLTTLIGLIIVGTIAQFGWVGIPDPNLSSGDNSVTNFKLYPNPAKDILYLKANRPIDRVVLYNMLGQQVIFRDIDDHETRLDMSSLSSGQYLIKATIDGTTENHTIVKQ